MSSENHSALWKDRAPGLLFIKSSHHFFFYFGKSLEDLFKFYILFYLESTEPTAKVVSKYINKQANNCDVDI